MELVRGIRITEYCDRHDLCTGERLNLFIKVCQAIQHAHRKGIMHRDIKPSNILVAVQDGEPLPKVIDFGIAKAIEGWLTDATVYTRLHRFIGTPAYMSPGQAELGGPDRDLSGSGERARLGRCGWRPANRSVSRIARERDRATVLRGGRLARAQAGNARGGRAPQRVETDRSPGGRAPQRVETDRSPGGRAPQRVETDRSPGGRVPQRVETDRSPGGRVPQRVETDRSPGGRAPQRVEIDRSPGGRAPQRVEIDRSPGGRAPQRVETDRSPGGRAAQRVEIDRSPGGCAIWAPSRVASTTSW
jgi:hypothetical protein